ncbi:MAG: hypothetical protein IH968_14230 [Gemmatimonadetes bacterium]|nr:hypothetical protein [Gemmatimonadota bacterium]
MCEYWQHGGDGGYLLRLLAFEILLKALHLVTVGPPKRSHSYVELMGALPLEYRNRIWSSAAVAPGVPHDAALHNKEHLLKTFSKNFVDLRYPYDKYTGDSPEEYHAKGARWIAAGAPTEEADFTYYPSELGGLTQAIQQEVEMWLSDQDA